MPFIRNDRIAGQNNLFTRAQRFGIGPTVFLLLAYVAGCAAPPKSKGRDAATEQDAAPETDDADTDATGGQASTVKPTVVFESVPKAGLAASGQIAVKVTISNFPAGTIWNLGA